jgi:3-dehydrosphinganine reductase
MAESLGYLTIASLVFGFLLILPSIMGLFGGNRFNVQGKVRFPLLAPDERMLTLKQTVLITGASEGMGKSVAKQLAAKGANIIIVARNVATLKDALEEIKVCGTSPSSQHPY